MPIKEFQCVSCGHKFDEILGIKDPNPSKCPKCGAGELKQLLSTFRIIGARTKSFSRDQGLPEEDGGPDAGGFGEGMPEGDMGGDLGDDDAGDDPGGEEGMGGDDNMAGDDLGGESPELPPEEDKD